MEKTEAIRVGANYTAFRGPRLVNADCGNREIFLSQALSVNIPKAYQSKTDLDSNR
jgi:hypothetical protein